MYKRQCLTMVSTLALTTLWVLAGVTAAQKGPVGVSGAPIRSSDVKLGKNPGGGAAARILTPDSNGRIDLSALPPGSYWLEVIPLSEKEKAANGDYNYLAVTITGSRVHGESITRSFDLTRGQFLQPRSQDLTARTGNAPQVYTTRFEFEIGVEPGVGPPTPTFSTIVKSKSNICNN
jgi:hypothetical protein